ncbi:hypothetical protein V2J09_011837 [Rumex salicifolius]
MASSGLVPNSFLVATSPPSKPKSLKSRRFVVLSKNAGLFSAFRSSSSSSPSDDGPSPSSKPFQINFGKLPDLKSLVPVVRGSPGGGAGVARRKDAGTVYVAGANGQVGVRIVQALLRQGFKVRAGVSDLSAAQELARFAALYKVISKEEAKSLNAVQSTFDDAESIAKSIGNASKVVVTIGPTENGPEAEVTTLDALQVVEAAQLAGVGHVAVIYDESASNSSSTYNVLDGITSFFNNLFAKSQPLTVQEFLQKVVETDVRYTFIKTKLADDFMPESSYNVVVAAEGGGGENDYKVSKSRMATIVADVFSNTSVAENKDGRRQVYAEEIAKAKAEEKAAKEEESAKEAAKAAKKLSEKQLQQQAMASSSSTSEEEAEEEANKASVESLINKAKGFGAGISWDKLSSQLSTAVQKSSVNVEIPKVQVATIRGQAKARNLTAQKAVTKQTTPRKPVMTKKAKEEAKVEEKKEVRNILGGLFKQETIYMDE